ncbi:DEAD/DEAH box helicase [Arthrobacter sunyaminii]|uniref:DEAD/DEAH box helicase family protein n=1 Tax=Arthrobacter sunyaminii TaxID=2816859 RepID=A0A975S6S9_9MICC|nr:SNF2-related protein [Arthrobacter sunyaminii]MBO0907791.1 DEAD/DEAH box helicase family protein [Arthrobacter sunyaminii]QWQ36851.1 DEAD/DEAH box helicase family protein [Arthrobacter sunyaminii]
MRENLSTLAAVLRRFLERELPSLGPDWWNQGVLAKLTYQQRALVDENGWSSLTELDAAAVLRVADQNWDLFRRKNLVKWDDRNWLKEASSVRNRWAHDAPGREPSPHLAYRDLDTLSLLAHALDPGSPEAEQLAEARSTALAGLAPASRSLAFSGTAAPITIAPSGLVPGTMVRVKARPELTGAIMHVDDSGSQLRLKVFHGQMTQIYFESQVEIVETKSAEHLGADELKTRITAAHVLHPSVNRLYSLNTGRIEYEPYQYRPVMKMIAADRPRLLIADDVGVGKTIEAGLIIKELQARQQLDSILVICPKPLVVENKWRNEMKRFDEDFAHLDASMLRHCIDEVRAEGRWPTRYRKAILPYSLLNEKLLLGDDTGRRPRPGLTSLLPPVKFDLVIVDEAHHVRNSETWGHRVVKHLLDSAEAAVLISATPIQTGSEDLRTLLRLLRPDTFVDNQTFDLMREPNAYLANVESAVRLAGDTWQTTALEALTEALQTSWGSRVLRADPRTQEIRDLLGQNHVTDHDRVKALRLAQSMNTFSGLINRTRRRDIGSFTTRKSETFEVDFTPDQAELYGELLDLAGRIATSKGHGQSLDFVLSTLQRQAASCLNGLAPFIEDLLQRKLTHEELSEADVEADELDASLLESFVAEIREIATSAAALTEDPKLERLMSYVDEKQQLSNNKLLVFSTFRHTLRYLHSRLVSAGARVGLVHGGISDDDRRDLRARFAKDKREPDAIDVLLSSEVGTEGLDYQFCDALVNYDLPWNPMRIEQRIGRIDRRGQQSESVSIKNLIVSGTVDAAIFERCLMRIGVFQRALGGSEAILGELTREIRKIGEDLTLTEPEREVRLQQLADNRIGRIQEQEQLEERESALFGLPLKKLDAEGVEQAASPWLAPSQLARLVQRYLLDCGYERADSLFERPVALIRPSKDVRSTLYADAQATAPESGSLWQRWLSRGTGQSRRLTFDPGLADSNDVELLSPVHELVRAAAKHQEGFSAEAKVALQVQSKTVPAGLYPLAVHAWTYLGSRDDFEVAVATTDSALSEEMSRLLIEASDSSASVESHAAGEVDERHYMAWTDSRTAHIDRTRGHVENQLASLTTTHHARVQLLEDQIGKASHENIRRMRESELRSLEDDYGTRIKKLKMTIQRSDVTTTLLCSGIVEVVGGD